MLTAYTVLFDPGHVTCVAVGDAVEVPVDVLVLPPLLVVVREMEVEVTNFAPQIPAFGTAAPRLDLR